MKKEHIKAPPCSQNQTLKMGAKKKQKKGHFLLELLA